MHVGVKRTLGPAPTSLADVEAAADLPCVDLAGLRVDEQLLRLDDGAGLALVVDAEDFASDLEFAAFACHGNRLEKFELALAVEHTLGVELGDALDGRAI